MCNTIKVGNIVKFISSRFLYGESSLVGALGMVTSIASVNNKTYMIVMFDKEGRNLLVTERYGSFNRDLELVPEERVANINLAEYFPEESIRKYRGDINEDDMMKPVNRMRPVDPIPYTPQRDRTLIVNKSFLHTLNEAIKTLKERGSVNLILED